MASEPSEMDLADLALSLARKSGQPLHRTQKQIVDTDARFKLAICGRRWGKSLLAAYIALAFALLGKRVWVIGLTYEQTDRILEVIWTWLGKSGHAQYVAEGTRRSERKIYLKTGGFIVGKSADHPDSLVGESLDLVVLDEAPIMPRRVWDQQVRPCLSDRRGRALLIGTPRGHNWCFDLYSKARRDDAPGGDAEWYAWRAPSWTNTPVFPGGTNDPEIDAARRSYADAGMDALFDQEYGASFTALQGRCYSRFNAAQHIVGQAEASRSVVEVIGGADWGHRDPCALVVCGRTNDSQWRVLDEWYTRGATHPEVMKAMDELSARHRVRHWWCDSAEPARIVDCQQHGFDARPAWKDAGSILSGIATVGQFMGRPGGFLVSNTCRNLIREVEALVWHPTSKTESTQGDDHACDAMRYCIATEERSASRVFHTTRIPGL